MFAWDDPYSRADEDVAGAPIDALSIAMGACQLELLRRITELPGDGHDWERWGARDGAHWLGMRMGISYWKASRMLQAASALGELPRLSAALRDGALELDKVLELARFATASDEAELISWATTHAASRIRREGDRRRRQEAEEVREIERTRSVHWWFQDGSFELEASLPAAQGATVAKALERVAETIPVMPGEEGAYGSEQRRADALVVLCSGRLASDPDPDRATVVVHAQLADLNGSGAGSEIESGDVVAPASVQRLLCDARAQVLIEDEHGEVVGVSSTRREPSAWMVRQVRYRDRTCRFPGCDARRFTQAHHIRFWSNGGRTELSNLVLICGFHHRLVHEHGWRISRGDDGTVRWLWPDGRAHRPGHSPDEEAWAEIARRLAHHRSRRRRSPGPAPATEVHRPVRRELTVSRT
jgi:hypothetical protein